MPASTEAESSRLGAHEAELHRRGVRHAALFGFIAHGEDKRTSYVDILIELDPQAPVRLYEYFGITQFLAILFPVQIDVANRGSSKALVERAPDLRSPYKLASC